MRYDTIMCMMVDDSVKTNDELSLAQKKQVVTELKGFLKKSYNFSDESEYARAYEDIRQMFTIGSKKSISGLFENTVKKTGAHDSIETEDAMFVQLKFGSGRTEGAKLEENEYREYAEALLKKYGEKRVTLSKQGKVIVTYTNPNDSKTLDHAIRSCDGNKIELPEISDTWRLIDKYNIKYTTSNGKIYIDIDEAKNKGVKEDYIKRLSKMTRLYGRGDF